MATVNKDFKIKSGLIVEGTTATVNGYDILTKKPADDQYIIDLIGGETLVKSVSAEFDVSGAGELSIDRATVDAYYDAAGDAADALTDANAYTDGRETAITTAYEAYADQVEVDANSYTDGRETAITTAYQNYADTAETDANAYTDGRETAITTAYEAYADQAESDAVTSANSYTDGRETAITTAYQSYADTAEADAVTTANAYTDQEVAALVNGAPALLDTLNELAAAIDDDPNFASTLTTLAGEKVAKAGDTMTGLLVLSADPSANLGAATKQYVDTAETDAVSSANSYTDTREGLITTAYESYADTAESDAVTTANSYTDGEITTALSTAQGYANTAETNAIAHADALTTDDVAEGTTQYFTDARAKASAGDLLAGATTDNVEITYVGGILSITAENGVADSDTDDLTEGSTNLYFTDARALTAINDSNIQPSSIDITWVRREEATWTDINTASKVACHSTGTSTGSMKYLVRVVALVGGTRHSHVTEVLATVAGDNGVAVVEYGTIYTSAEPLATVTVEWNAGTSAYDLNVTTANNNSEVMVAATLITALD